MFSIPGALHFDECELYFDSIHDDVDFLDRDSGYYLGRDRKYSYARQDPGDFPRRRLVISSDELKKPWPIKMQPMMGSPPLDRTPREATYFIGCGWSSMMSFER
jgi:hypothetical protein